MSERRTERRRAEDQEVIVRRLASVTLLVLTAVLAVLSVVNSFVAADRARQQSYELRESQITACRKNGNTLREGLRDFISSQIQNVKQTDPALFPYIPRETFDALIDERVAELRAIKNNDFANVKCLDIYPLLDGQTLN